MMSVDHAALAERNFIEGMNCAQSVFAAFSDVTGFDRETAMKLASSFGGGMGRLREVCGTCSAMFMVVGLLYGLGEGFTQEEKAEHYRRVQYLAGKFREKHETIVCRELLKGLAVTRLRSRSSGQSTTTRSGPVSGSSGLLRRYLTNIWRKIRMRGRPCAAKEQKPHILSAPGRGYAAICYTDVSGAFSSIIVELISKRVIVVPRRT